MVVPRLEALLGRLYQTFRAQDRAALTDAQLLGAYLDGREEEAFALLVRRHGPMVWGVCRRMLRQVQDAEDAYQATFLILVRKAAAVWPREKLGAWLHGVAFQVARKAQAQALRRFAREKPLAEQPAHAADAPEANPELRRFLDRELAALPEKYRTLLILCDLEGHTRREVATQLGCPEGTVAGRLARAREMLARRLARHGPLLSTSALTCFLASEAAASSRPPAWTVQVLHQSADVLALTEGVLHMMSLSKLKLALTLVLGVALGMIGLSGLSPQAQAGKPAGLLTTPGETTTPREKPDDQQAVWEQLQAMRWYFEVYHPEQRTLKVTDTPLPFVGLEDSTLTADPYGRLALERLPVAPDARITIEGRPARWQDLRQGMQLTLRFAPGTTTVMAIDARTTHQHLVVHAVDAAQRTITVALGSQGTLRELSVDKNALIYPYPPAASLPLEEVKPGMKATLKLTFTNGRLVVTDLQVRK